MKLWMIAVWLITGIACSDPPLKQPADTNLNLRLATTGASRFEDYIHTLNIYAFRKTVSGDFVYAETLAELDAEEIAGLQDDSDKGDAKLFNMNLEVGTYQIFMIGNAAGRLAANWTEGITTPAEVVIRGNPEGQDSIFFLGQVDTVINSSYRPPVPVILNRVVSKLVFVLYGVPVQIDSVSLNLGNLASEVSINGIFAGTGKMLAKSYPVRKNTAEVKDTIVGEVLTLPSLAGGSPCQLIFYSRNGQKRIKEMPVQTLLPDKYLRMVGIMNDNPGGLLDFEVKLKSYLVDYWYDKTLPDFVVNRQE